MDKNGARDLTPSAWPLRQFPFVGRLQCQIRRALRCHLRQAEVNRFASASVGVRALASSRSSPSLEPRVARGSEKAVNASFIGPSFRCLVALWCERSPWPLQGKCGACTANRETGTAAPGLSSQRVRGEQWRSALKTEGSSPG